MDWLQNSNIWAKTRMVLISLALLLASSFVLTRINWVQLSHAINLVQAQSPPVAVPAITDDTSESVLPTVEPESTIATPAAIPASDHASEVAVVATSCAAQKQAAQAKYNTAVNAENDTNKKNKSKISDSYSARGMAFSSAQKKAQKTESDRHDKALKQLEKNHQTALKALNC